MKADYSQLPDEDAAQAIYGRLRSVDDAYKTNYSAVGLMLAEAKRRALWQLVIDPDTGFPCRSFTRFIRVSCPNSHSSAFAALADIEELADIPAGELAQMPHCGLSSLRELSTAVRADPDIIEAAKQPKTANLMALVQQRYPEQHAAAPQWIKMRATPEQADEIREAVEMAIRNGDASSLTDWVFQQAIAYKQNVQERQSAGVVSRMIQ